jgi:predicted double-glycine peptidase
MDTPPLLQRQYAVSSALFNRSIATNHFGTIDEFDDDNTILEEPSLLNIITDNIEDEDNLDNYLVSNEVTSCYSTPSVLNTMRSFSQNL